MPRHVDYGSSFWMWRMTVCFYSIGQSKSHSISGVVKYVPCPMEGVMEKENLLDNNAKEHIVLLWWKGGQGFGFHPDLNQSSFTLICFLSWAWVIFYLKDVFHCFKTKSLETTDSKFLILLMKKLGSKGKCLADLCLCQDSRYGAWSQPDLDI